ncbi:MAG: ATP-binding cassette domain-containing protein, partial [Microcystaceae cyanobacterium]
MDFSSLLIVQDLGRYFGKPGKGGAVSSPDSGGPGRWLWRGVNFEVNAGDWWGIVAPSGTGKTLLLRNLVLLDPLQQGQVSYQGKPLSAWSLPLYRSQVI